MAYARNGCQKFECKPAEGLVKPFRTRPQNVAAIDFGTANCSLMYLLSVNKMKDPAGVEPVRLKLDGHFRVPNCALFDRKGKMIAFGLYAQRLYYKSTKRQDLKDVFFFQRIKMQLQHDKVSKLLYYTLKFASCSYACIYADCQQKDQSDSS